MTSGWISLMPKPSKERGKWGSCIDISFLLPLQPLAGKFHTGHMKERFYPTIWKRELVLWYFRRWLFFKYNFTHYKQTLNSQKESLVTKWAITLWKCRLPSMLFYAQITQYSDCFVQLLRQIIQLCCFCCILKPSMGYPCCLPVFGKQPTEPHSGGRTMLLQENRSP